MNTINKIACIFHLAIGLCGVAFSIWLYTINEKGLFLVALFMSAHIIIGDVKLIRTKWIKY